MKQELKQAFIEMILKLGNDPSFSYLDSDNNLYKVVNGEVICKKAISKDGGYTYEWI